MLLVDFGDHVFRLVDRDASKDYRDLASPESIDRDILEDLANEKTE